MNPISYSQTLTQAGLNQDQALIYEVLIKNGPLPAGKIHQKTPLKRGLVYKVLDELVQMGLVSKKDEPYKVAIFEPAHPLKLKELAEEKEKQAKQAQTALSGILGQITSDFNLVSGKPGVQYFEGIEGIKKITQDSLTAQDEIYSYVDNERIYRFIPKINEEYVKKRQRLGIKKKMITIDSEYIRKRVKDYDPKISEVRVIPAGKFPFFSVMQIYNNKISYLTLDEKTMIGIIIEDPYISRMHRTLFEYDWSMAKPLLPISLDEKADNTFPRRDNLEVPPQS